MQKTITRITSILAVTVLLLLMPLSIPQVSAAKTVDQMREEIEQLKKEEAEIQSKLEGLGSSIKDQQQEVNQLYKKVANLEAQIGAYQSQISAIDKEIADQNARIEVLNAEIKVKEEEMAAVMNKLKKRVKAITKTNNHSSFQLLMDTENYADYLLKSKIVESVSAYDQSLRQQAENEKHGIEVRKDQIVVEQAASEAAKAELQVLKGDLDTQFESLDKLYTTAKNKENALLKQQGSYQQKIDKIAAAEDALEREIHIALNGTPPTDTYGGKMYWPLPGVSRISSGYGNRNGGKHKAIDISNGRCLGMPIYAAASGTVLLAGWHYSYGNYVKLDHGLDSRGVRITTLYAHMQYTPAVKVGQKVHGGITVLGKVGNTGESYGAHLHFEVRENNVHVNPLKGYVVPPK